jgi:hypothetical protein
MQDHLLWVAQLVKASGQNQPFLFLLGGQLVPFVTQGQQGLLLSLAQ